jgi:hypothetical protein
MKAAGSATFPFSIGGKPQPTSLNRDYSSDGEATDLSHKQTFTGKLER